MGDWQKVCLLDDIPKPGAFVVQSLHGPIAVFRNDDDEVFALLNRCPHKGGPLSKGTICGREVECPLHGWAIDLEDGCAIGNEGRVRSFQAKLEGGSVFLFLGD